MSLYCGIDLHSNNQVIVVIDDNDKRLLERRVPNDLAATLSALDPFREELLGVAVESTYNWYWLVDGLSDHGYSTRLVNTAAVQQYSGLKYTDDQHDAFCLAHLMRLGILPTGYICPRESNDRKKGEGNKKCGNRYLAWAFSEAAHFAVRYNDRARRFFDRKTARLNRMVAIRAVAHKLARAAYFIQRDRVEFDAMKLFG